MLARPSEKHPTEQGLKQEYEGVRKSAEAAFGETSNRTRIETKMKDIEKRNFVPSEKHPTEQGLKLTLVKYYQAGIPPSEKHPTEQGLKHFPKC